MTSALTDRGRTVRSVQVAVVAVFFVHGVVLASWAAHIPQIKSHLHIGDGTLGIALLGQPIGSISATLVAGYFVPRFGSRILVQVSLVGYCLSGPFIGLAGSVVGLFIALFVWGAFMGVLDISMNAQAIAVEHVKRQPLMNGMHAGWSIGAFTGAGVGTLSVAVGITLPTQLLVVGSVALLVAGWLSVRMLTDARDAGRPAPRPAGRRFSGPVLVLAAIAFASMLSEGAAADWSSVYLHDTLGSSAAVGGLAYTAFTLSMLAIRLMGNRLLTRYRADLLLPLLAGSTTVAFAAALVVGDIPAGLIAFFALGAGVGAVVPTAFSAAGRLPGIHPGVAVAMVSGVGWAGFLLGPPLIGQLADRFGLAAALVVIPVLTAFIAGATSRVPALHAPPR